MSEEGALSRGLTLTALAVIVTLFTALMAGFFVGSYEGTDENGYMLSAKRYATAGSGAKHINDPYEFVSGNWVETQKDVYYAKYPTGYPALCFLAYKLGGPAAAFLVNPLLATFAVVGIFLLGRAVVNGLAGAFAAILLATNPLHGFFGLSALSHSGAICFAVWGMFFLWRWSQSGGGLNAFCAGALCGYAYTVRYTEGLLVLPALAMVGWRWRSLPAEQRRGVLTQGAMMVAGGLVAALPLLVHQWIAYGAPWITGYSLCGESVGFGWKWFQENWWLMLSRMDASGLYLIFPIGLFGLVYLAFHDMRRCLFLGLWTIPALLLYTAYYWAPQGAGMGYIRFFVSIFPPLIISALAVLNQLIGTKPLAAVGTGLFVLLVATSNLRESTRELERRTDRLEFSKRTSEIVSKKLPINAIVLSDDRVLNFIEYVGDYRLYSQQMFDRTAMKNWLKVLDDNEPHPFQRQKAMNIGRLIGDKTDSQLAEMLSQIVSNQWAEGRTVALVTSQDAKVKSWRGRLSRQIKFKNVSEWVEVQRGAKDEARPVSWALYTLTPRQSALELAEATTRADIEEKIDQLQFDVRTLRDEYNALYPGAAQKWAKVADLEKQIRELQDKLARLQKKAPVIPKVAMQAAPVVHEAEVKQ